MLLNMISVNTTGLKFKSIQQNKNKLFAKKEVILNDDKL